VLFSDDLLNSHSLGEHIGWNTLFPVYPEHLLNVSGTNSHNFILLKYSYLMSINKF
jgi:hypothetical protein